MEIVYSTLKEEDILGLTDCICDVFPSSEPMCKLSQITKEEFRDFAQVISQDAVKNGISHVAKDTKTGKIVGYRVSHDLKAEANPEMEKVIENFPKIQPILFLLDSLEKMYVQNKTINKGEVLYWFMVKLFEKI
jgi:hypothetical protein